jgi:hypothetical protein
VFQKKEKKANIKPNGGMKIENKIAIKETCTPVKLVRFRFVRKMRIDCIPISAKRLMPGGLTAGAAKPRLSILVLGAFYEGRRGP